MPKVFRRKYTCPKIGREKQTKNYYGHVTDEFDIRQRIPLCSDKAASETMLNEIRTKAERARHGLSDPFDDLHKRPLAEHLPEFIRILRDAGRSADYVGPVESRCRRIISGCKFRMIGDISASRVQSFLAELRRDGMGQKTANDYLQAIKQFARWLVSDRRTNDNRLAHLKGGNTKVDVRRERRELTEDELRRLLETARNCTSKRFTLNGWQRFTLYTTALGTGLRAAELGSLTPARFDLESSRPTVRIDAADEKSRWGDVIPLPADLVSLLRPWIAEMGAEAPVWPGKWAKNKRGGKFLQVDLKVAKRKWIEEADGEAEKHQRERSDFLAYQDGDGCFADFHALRHTYLSRLGRSGASPKEMQRLARHRSVELTLGRYTHANLYDLASAVDGMPPLPISPPASDVESQSLRATGTDDLTADSTGPLTGPELAQNNLTGPELARTPVRPCPPVSLKVHSAGLAEGEHGEKKTPLKNRGVDHDDRDCPLLTADGHDKREWTGIEPTWLLLRGHAGFEAQ